jgi:Protein of unknown function (DUF4043)
MALTTIQSNNKLVQYRKEIIREYVRENLFSPYMGDELTSIIRLLYDQKKGGEQVNIPIVSRLNSRGKGVGTLVGNEERIDNYGCRLYVDWARNAVKTNKAEDQKDSADVFGIAKPLLSDWGKELQRDEIIEALMAIPSEAAPAGLGSDEGQRVNGVLYQNATAAQRNTWQTDNSDRLLFGNTTANLVGGNHASSLTNVDNVNDLFNADAVALMKLLAKKAQPRIRPYQLKDGREYFVAFCGSLAFRDFSKSMQTINQNARPRENLSGTGNAPNNPIYQDGDEMYRGVIVREVPEIDTYVDEVWTSLLTAGAGGTTRVNPVFLCGQSAVAMPYAQMPQPTVLNEDDYSFVEGAGIEMCYGVGKLWKKVPMDGTALKQWGVVQGFFASTAT